MVGRETILKEALAPVMGGYDYVLVDCPPSLGLLTLNALTTVREVFIPLQTEFFALQGMTKLMETIRVVRPAAEPGFAGHRDHRLHVRRPDEARAGGLREHRGVFPRQDVRAR